MRWMKSTCQAEKELGRQCIVYYDAALYHM